jgi:Carboxypeptidase regulatory-like domain
MGALLCVAAPACFASHYGKLKGVVFNPSGTPQMGASILLDPEAVGGSHRSVHLLSDENGVFGTPRLRPGLYSMRVTMAGFLPAIEQHVRVQDNLTTVVHVDLESIFSSVDQLRRPSARRAEGDDWKWVLRSSSSTRSILQWLDGSVLVAAGSGDVPAQQQSRTRVVLTNGARRPGSSSGLPGPPATAVSYDQPLGAAGRLLLGGQMIYDPAAGAGVAFSSIWIPGGRFGHGPETTVVMRQERSGPGRQTVRRLRIEHSEQMALGDRVVLDYGAEYLMAGVDSMTSSLRPRGRITVRIAPRWTAAFGVETGPGEYGLRSRGPSLESALDAMDTLPVLIWHNGQPALEGGWHEEVSLDHDLSARSSVEVAAFRDSTRHQAVFGFSPNPQEDSTLEQCSGACAFDAGPGKSWGARVVYRQKLADDFEVDAIYAWAGAPALDNGPNLGSELQDALHTQYRHSFAGRVAGTVPRVGTQFAASYKWLSGPVVGRQDLYGEAAMGIDPNLSITIRQPLPCFHTGGHWEALADFRNLLAQGYVPIQATQGRMVLVPVLRSFRGGVSFQF